MRVESLTVGPFESNCHLIIGDNNQTLVIDPGDDAQKIIQFIRKNKLNVIGYPITHGHIDHVSGLAAVHTEFPAPIGMHPRDETWAFSPVNMFPPFYNQPPEAPSKIERTYQEGQTWEDGGMRYNILETPGHSPGSVSFYFPDEKILISGDVLFQGSIGRTDLPGGDMRVLEKSLKRLCELPDDTIVYPGHGPATTLGIEKKTNFYLR